MCVIVNIKTLADLHKSQTIAAETQLLCNVILYARVEYKVFFFSLVYIACYLFCNPTVIKLVHTNRMSAMRYYCTKKKIPAQL